MASGDKHSPATTPGSSEWPCEELSAKAFIGGNQRSTDGLELSPYKERECATVPQDGLWPSEEADDPREPEDGSTELQHIQKLRQTARLARSRRRAGQYLLKREHEPVSCRLDHHVIAVFGKRSNLVKGTLIHTFKYWSGLYPQPPRMLVCCVHHSSLAAFDRALRPGHQNDEPTFPRETSHPCLLYHRRQPVDVAYRAATFLEDLLRTVYTPPQRREVRV